MAFDLADVVPLAVRIYDATGALADAGSVTLTIGLPDGTSATPTVLHTATGTYQVSYSPTMAGRHTVTWVATGANASGYSDAFDVVTAPRYIISLADAKKMLNIVDASADDDLRSVLEAATEVVERVKGQAMVQRSFTEEHELVGNDGRMALSWTPVVALTSLVMVDGWVSWDPSKLHVDQKTGVVSSTYQSGLLQLYGRIQVTYTAGYSVIPATCQEAAKVITAHLWQTRRGNRGAPRAGGVDDTSMVPGFAFAVPNRALELLGTGMPGFA